MTFLPACYQFWLISLFRRGYLALVCLSADGRSYSDSRLKIRDGLTEIVVEHLAEYFW